MLQASLDTDGSSAPSDWHSNEPDVGFARQQCSSLLYISTNGLTRRPPRLLHSEAVGPIRTAETLPLSIGVSTMYRGTCFRSSPAKACLSASWTFWLLPPPHTYSTNCSHLLSTAPSWSPARALTTSCFPSWCVGAYLSFGQRLTGCPSNTTPTLHCVETDLRTNPPLQCHTVMRSKSGIQPSLRDKG